MSYDISSWHLIVDAEEFELWRADHDITNYTVVNRGRLSAAVGCPMSALLRFGAGIVRDANPYKSEWARLLGKAIHASMACLSKGEKHTDVARDFDLGLTDELTALVERDPHDTAAIENAHAKTEQWTAWMDAASGVLAAAVTNQFGLSTDLWSVEHPVLLVNESEGLVICTVPDAIGTWNDGVWGYETKTIAPSKDLAAASRAYARSLQVTIQSLATALWAQRAGKPFMGTMLQFVSKRAVPTHPDDVKCAKLCECGASSMDVVNMTHGEILQVAAKHPKAGSDGDWVRSHVQDESAKLARYEQRQRQSRLAWSEWPEKIVHVEAQMLNEEDLEARLARDLPWHLLAWLTHRTRAAVGGVPDAPRQTDECYVFSPCAYNGRPCDMTSEWFAMCEGDVLPEGWRRRAPDYVDMVESGQWADEAYDVYEWEEDSDE